MNKSKAPPKGQRSIASFIFKKTIPDETQSGDPGGSESKAGPSTSAPTPNVSQKSSAEAPPPSKRARGDGSPSTVPVRPVKTTTPPNAEERHHRWQNKLVGDNSAGMERLRTQDALQKRGESQKMTPLELQVAALQRQHPDTLLAIEVGYKFRFFGKDAEIASHVLGIFAYPDRNYLTAGVPTVTIDRHVRRLVQAGHKVGVVRQTESAAIKASGDNRNKPFERKLAAVYTRATLEAGEMAAAGGRSITRSGGGDGAGEEDGGIDAAGAAEMRFSDAGFCNEHRSAFLVCVVEEPLRGHSGPSGLETAEIGVCAVETSTGQVFYSSFHDSPMRAELESRLMFAAPSDLLLVQPLSNPTRRLLEAYGGNNMTSSSKNVSNGSATISGSGIRTELVDGNVYKSGGALSAVIDFYKDPRINNGRRSAAEGEGNDEESGLDAVMKLPPLVLRALAHSLDYLKPFKLEAVFQLGASFRDFSEMQELALSPNTLSQLEILRNSDDGKERGSLLWLMDRTLTAAGARQIRRWVSRPLRDLVAIEERLSAVEELLKSGAEHPVLSRVPGVLKDLPDLERILGRLLHRTSSPPEFLELLKVFRDLHLRLGLQANLDALEAAVATRNETFQNEQRASSLAFSDNEFQISVPTDIQAPLLAKELAAAADLRCAAVSQATLASIDVDSAASGDILRLFADDERFPEFAEKRKAVVAAEAVLQGLRPGLASTLNVRSVEYVSIANQGDYLVEVPVELEKRAPKSWEKISSTKKAVRFRPLEVKKALNTLELAQEHLGLAAKAAWVQVQTEFSEHYSIFASAVRALATLDCLNGFAALAASGAYVRPEFVDNSSPPQLHIIGGRHPVLDVLLEGAFVPNDLHLGPGRIDGMGGGETGGPSCGESEVCAVITGPNMGGKSCYIRQAALIAIMAQAGCFVPATACRLHAFDAVMTRMGAADNIALGRSTFLEELGETSEIIHKATSRSLVIIDELGRGTSTKDGRAIAAATLEYLCTSLRCLTLFVTHYPEVAKVEKRLGGAAGSYYMAYVLEKDGENDGNEGNGVPKVTFLYKAERGVAEASYGLNVAVMAGLPRTVINRAAEKAQRLVAASADVGEVAAEEEEARGIERLVREVTSGLKLGIDKLDAEKLFELQKRVKSAI